MLFDEETLYIILVVNNAIKNNNKINMYQTLRANLEKYDNVSLITVECAFLGLPFILTEPHFEPYNIQIRTDSPIHLKYNLINIAIAKLPRNFKYLAWVDVNIDFINKEWVDEALENLKKYKLIKLYDEVLLIGKNGEDFGPEVLKKKDRNSLVKFNKPQIKNPTNNPGNAWAFDRNIIEKFNGNFFLLLNISYSI